MAFDEKEWSPNTQPMQEGKSSCLHGPKIDFCNRMRACCEWGFVVIDKEAHMWMAESWKQPQVPLIPLNNEPHTIGDLCPITFINAQTPRCTLRYLHGG